MLPDKLEEGDEVRVIAPSRSLSIISSDVRKLAERNLESLGLEVTYSEHAEESGEFRSPSLSSRLSDIHAAFSDSGVKAILSSIGGWNANQLLPHLDYSLIAQCSKIFCGYSDITALQNAIYAKTGMVTYSGPHFSSFGMEEGLEYTVEYFRKCLFSESPFEILPSPRWSEDEWFIDQEDRTFIDNPGHFIINEGLANGEIVGGNLGTFSLLKGTEYMPDLEGKVLFFEDCLESPTSYLCDFDRELTSLMQQPGFEDVEAIVLGRLQSVKGLTRQRLKEKLVLLVEAKSELDNIPVIGGVDFGHTTPQITFPIGGTVEIAAEGDETEIKMMMH